jgi:predicted HTH transcriptional regulator
VPRDLATIPIETITFEDLKDLLGTEEGFRLEFKEALATDDGRADRWMTDQSRVGNVARDDLTREIVAFANAYGGILIVGVKETDDNPKRAKSIAEPQIPNVVDCAEQLDRSLRSIIEPPLPMIEVRGIVSEADRGVLVIRVSASSSAPHGFGRPSAAYVRRGSNAEPLMMRDLQSIFVERRTRLERMNARRERLRFDGDQLRISWTKGRLPLPL